MDKYKLNRDTTIALEDFPSDKKNCGNCTRKSGICPRTKSDKTQHNGYLFSQCGELSGIIYCCPHYTGIYEHPNFDFNYGTKQANLGAN